jgi:1-acyl-sn-glycerol-3-phosphate acyltransferase
MAVRLKVPVVPIFIQGLYDVYSVHHSWPSPGPVHVTIGAAMNFSADTDYSDAAQRIEDAVRELEP